jgi:cold shock protein
MYVIESISLGSELRIVKDRASPIPCGQSHTTEFTKQERLTMTGTIKKIIRQKGFGFITPDDGSEDVFFHRGSLAPRTQIEDFNEGDTVQFQTRKGDKGPVALDLKIR